MSRAALHAGLRPSRGSSSVEPVTEVILFERSWYREFLLSTRQLLSDPATWPLALDYDQAVIQLSLEELKVINSGGVTTGAAEVTLYFSDSSDGVAWSTIGSSGALGSVGSHQVVVEAPFAGFLRVELQVGRSSGTGLGLAKAEARMTLRRRGGRAKGGAARLSAPLPVRSARSAGGGCGCEG